MKINSIRYPLTNTNLDNDDIKSGINVLKSKWITMGRETLKFEKEFSKQISKRSSIMVNSGSSANLLIFQCLINPMVKKLKTNDEVLLPAICWSTSLWPIIQSGLKVKFVDIDLKTLNIDINDLKKKITKKTKALMLVHALGNCADMQKIVKICKMNKIILIEDTCEALGSKHKGKQLGTFGDFSSYSFFYSHHISTMEGGMCVTDNFELYCILKSLRAHGWSRDLPKINTLTKSLSKSKQAEYNFVLPGYNLRPNELNGVLGLTQLKKLPHFLEGRKENARFFKKLFDNQPYCSIQKCDYDSSWYGFSILLEGALKNKRDYVLNELHNVGIETRPIVTGNFLKNSVCDFMNYEISGILKNVESVDRRGFFVGNSHINLENQLLKLSETLQKLYKNIN